MSLSFAIITVLEVLTGLFLIWGFLHEEKFVALEDRILARLRKKRTARRAQVIPFTPRNSGSGRGIS